MKVKDIVAMLEAEVPLAWQESYDNAGLAVGSPEAKVEKIVLALDITEEVVDEAIREGAQMVVSHHPIIFRPIKRLADESRQQRTIAKAIRHGVALYAAHTNLDSAPIVGISHHLAGLLGVQVEGVLEQGADEGVGIGVVGNLPQAVPTEAFLGYVKDVLGVEALRHSTVRVESVQRVAICSGSGGGLIEVAEKSGADVYISADFKYHDFVDADRMVLVDVGHFESEICAIEILFDILSKKITTFALRKSVCAENPVKYKI